MGFLTGNKTEEERIQEEINKKTVALVISASKMTGRVLQAAIREYLRQQQKNKNKSKMLL